MLARSKKRTIPYNKRTFLAVKTPKLHTVKKALKTAIFLILALACANGAQAQRRKVIYLQTYDWAPYHWGFLLGANCMTFNSTLQDNYQDIEHPASQLPQDYRPGSPQDHTYTILGVEPVTNYAGFSIGIIGDTRLGDFFNLRFIPTLTIGPHRIIKYRYYLDADKDHEESVLSEDKNSNFFEFPLHVKYRSKRYNNVGAYLIGGINPRIYLIRESKQFNQGDPALIQTKRGDVALDLGAGYDIYNQWFKMGIEIKFSFGLINVLKTDETSMNCIYNVPFKEIKNNQLQLSITIE